MFLCLKRETIRFIFIYGFFNVSVISLVCIAVISAALRQRGKP